jgi:hypothetical protein
LEAVCAKTAANSPTWNVLNAPGLLTGGFMPKTTSKKWKTLAIKFDPIPCPTLGEVRDVAKAIIDAGLSLKLSQEKHALLCIIANLILDEDDKSYPIMPKSKLNRTKSKPGKMRK